MSRHEPMVFREGHGVVTKSRAAEIDAAARNARSASPARSAIFDDKPVERGSWVIRNGKLLTRREAAMLSAQEAMKSRSEHPAPMVMGDIQPYRNTIDGKPVGGRAQHREFLKRHNVIEVGNERKAAMGTTVAVNKDDIARDIKETMEQLRAGYVNPDEGVLPAGAEPEMEPVVVGGGIKTGDYIRSDVLPAE